MSGRYKGVHHKGAPDLEDLRTLAEMVRQLQMMAAAINPQHPCQHPMAAARATVFACWAEVSGEGHAWSLPASVMLSDGRASRTVRPSNPGGPAGSPGAAAASDPLRASGVTPGRAEPVGRTAPRPGSSRCGPSRN